jgi:hypothetical protein
MTFHSYGLEHVCSTILVANLIGDLILITDLVWNCFENNVPYFYKVVEGSYHNLEFGHITYSYEHSHYHIAHYVLDEEQ